MQGKEREVNGAISRISGSSFDPILVVNIFDVRESIASYLNTDSILQRREIALDILSLFGPFLSQDIDEDLKSSVVNTWIRNSEVLSQHNTLSENLFDYLKNLDPIGVDLLELPKEINLHVLKSHYRKASKKYHPDVGGSHKEMLAINDSFSFFQDAIQSYSPRLGNLSGLGIPTFIPKSWKEFLFAIYLIMACINGDLFAADKSLLDLQEAFKYSKYSDPTQIAIVTMKLSGMGGVFYKPCDALSKFNMIKELRVASKISSYFTDHVIMQWSKDWDGSSEPDQFLSIEELTGVSPSHLVIQHIEQAKNALRLGAIGERRYNSVVTRLEQRKNERAEYLHFVDTFIENHSFLQKLSNAQYEDAMPTTAVIPPPSEDQKRFDHLSNIQKWEYLKIFGLHPTSNGFDKYFKIRTQEVLLGLIQNYDQLQLRELVLEVKYFSTAHRRFIPEYDILTEFYEHLLELDSVERRKKLIMLNMVDDPTFQVRSMDYLINFSIEGYNERKSNPDHRYSTEVTDRYIEFAKLPSDQIKAFNISGEYTTNYDISLDRDRSALRAFEESTIGKAYEYVWLHAKNPTRQDVIQSMQPYVEGLLELGKSFHPKTTGELQIGYSINKLTTAFAAEKEWEKVVYWAELLFNLPRHYRDLSSKSELRPLQKRIERAKKELAK